MVINYIMSFLLILVLLYVLFRSLILDHFLFLFLNSINCPNLFFKHLNIPKISDDLSYFKEDDYKIFVIDNSKPYLPYYLYYPLIKLVYKKST